ncbi:RNA polymerase I enhancer binding protein [Coemansia sp. RSA 1813]|nr:RNA polymerase I enhancer binding protein [Coemansia sp. RSA 1646]KAJ1769632.1 RNA polymerase I enhancer binding protein [Coemansia sp. RSA 1843]KAJ2090995.1 RNA polymerase I enhancer binding protein [Coemansia sp. RSA 986]KAJ2570252.1 RNA polymerase I enhancer binding protein [Coemansia sp. RSA 1813]
MTMQSISTQQSPRQRPDAAAAANECDLDSQGLISLIELLQTYPGLLDDKVETVARALTQATLAATEVSSRIVGRRQLTSLQRIRMSKSLAPVAISRAAAESQTGRTNITAVAPVASDGGDDQTARRTGRSGRKSVRRWFTQQHVQQLQSQGIVFTKGKFTAEENAAIDSAISSFVDAHGLDRQELYGSLFQQKTLSDPEKQLRRMIWPILAEALPTRQIQAIYHHVRRKYHPHNYLGAWAAGEDDELRRLVATHGPAWETIAQQMGRMGTNCRDRWRYIQCGSRGSQALPQRRQQQQQDPKPELVGDAMAAGASSAAPRNVETADKDGPSSSSDSSAGDVASIAPISAP